MKRNSGISAARRRVLLWSALIAVVSGLALRVCVPALLGRIFLENRPLQELLLFRFRFQGIQLLCAGVSLLAICLAGRRLKGLLRGSSGASPEMSIGIPVVVLAVVASLLIYSFPVDDFFAQDDFVLLELAGRIDSLPDLLRTFNYSRYAGRDFHRPVTQELSFYIGRSLFGLNAAAYHISSIAFHLLNSVLVYVLARALIRERMYALSAALIYLTSSCHLINIYWISNFQNLGSNLFSLCAILSYIGYRKGGKKVLYIGSLLLFIVCLHSKESTIALPLIMVCYELFIGRDRGKGRVLMAFVRPAPFFVAAGVYLALIITLKGLPHSPEYRASFGPFVLANFIRYLWYSCDNLFLIVLLIVGLRLVSMNGGLSVRTLSEGGVLGFAVSWFVIFILQPLFLPSTRPDYLTLSSVGYALAVGILIWRLALALKRYGRRAPALFLAVFLISSLLVSLVFTLNYDGLRGAYSITVLAERAETYLHDMMAMYPHLPRGAKLVFVSRRPRLTYMNHIRWVTAWGSLFRVFYGDDTIETLPVDSPPREGNVMVVEYDGQHLYPSGGGG